jgi:hypothetical protein
MSILTVAFASRKVKFFAVAALAGAALLLSQTFASPKAHADEPMQPGVQQIVLPGQVSIDTNKPDYAYFYPGEWVQICYHVPGQGYFQIFDQQAGQAPKLLKSGYDYDGFGCFSGVVTPPYGMETLRIVYYVPWYEGGGVKQDTTHLQVGYPF